MCVHATCTPTYLMDLRASEYKLYVSIFAMPRRQPRARHSSAALFRPSFPQHALSVLADPKLVSPGTLREVDLLVYQSNMNISQTLRELCNPILR